jgi:hypothetical protein
MENFMAVQDFHIVEEQENIIYLKYNLWKYSY